MALISTRIPLVLFSGGVDSTAVLHDALNLYSVVDVVTVSLTTQDHKTAREATAVATILKEFRKRHSKNMLTFGRIRNVDKAIGQGCRATNVPGFGQSPMWMAAAINSVREDTTDLFVGYINGDHQTVLLKETIDAWHGILLASGFGRLGLNTPPMTAPLAFMDKEQVLYRLQDPVLKYTSWCENHQEDNDCGRCPSCKTMMRALNNLKTFDPITFDRLPLKGRFNTMMRRWKASITPAKPNKDGIVYLK